MLKRIVTLISICIILLSFNACSQTKKLKLDLTKMDLSKVYGGNVPIIVDINNTIYICSGKTDERSEGIYKV